MEDYVASASGGQGFDIIFDTVGGRTLDQSFAAVRRHTGHVVSILGWGPHDLAPLSFRGATYSGVFTLLPLLTGIGRAHHGDILRQAATLVDSRQLAPRIHPRLYDLTTIAEAHHLVETGTGLGKVVIAARPDLLSQPSTSRPRSA